MNNNTFKLAFIGFGSGLLSYFFPEQFFLFNDFWFKPGTIFGIVLALYFFTFKKQLFSTLKSILWIIASTGSYIAAWWAMMTFPYVENENIEEFISRITPDLAIPLIIGGLVGACLMVLSYRYLLFPIKRKYIPALTILGGILALSWYIIPDGFLFHLQDIGRPSFRVDLDLPSQENIFGLIVFWQMGMASALGWVMDQAGNGKNK